jgi:hypothetical protein
LGGQSACDGNGIKLILEVYEAVTPGVEQNLFAVRGPARHVLFRGMIGQASGRAAGGGDDINIAIAIVLAGEGDHGAVGGEVGESLDPDPGSQPARIAAVAAHDPEIIRVIEDDLGLADGGET